MVWCLFPQGLCFNDYVGGYFALNAVFFMESWTFLETLNFTSNTHFLNKESRPTWPKSGKPVVKSKVEPRI